MSEPIALPAVNCSAGLPAPSVASLEAELADLRRRVADLERAAAAVFVSQLTIPHGVPLDDLGVARHRALVAALRRGLPVRAVFEEPAEGIIALRWEATDQNSDPQKAERAEEPEELSSLKTRLRPLVYADGQCSCCHHSDAEKIAIGEAVLAWWTEQGIDDPEEPVEEWRK